MDEKWSVRDLALRVVFFNSFFLAIWGAQTFTAAEKNEQIYPFLARANRLRAEAAAILEEGEDSEAAEHARAIECAAAFCEREAYDIAAGFDENDRLLVERHQAPPHVRAYCMQLAELMRFLYGDVLRGTVASIATAALDHQVSPANVRYWCENKSA